MSHQIDGETSSREAVVTGDRDALQPGTHTLGLDIGYVPKWGTRDAFREFYQNWKDAIMETFNLDLRSFKPVKKGTKKGIQITIHDPRSEALLGFIRFNKDDGSLELTNFKSKLKPKHLSLGHSTKRAQQDQFAGFHGEGFKLAALVMRRYPLAVKIESNSYFWNFKLRGTEDERHLCCTLYPRKAELVEEDKKKYAERQASVNFQRNLTSNIWEDVTVRVFKERKNQKAGDPKAKEVEIKIEEEDFLSWMKVTIDLDPPSSIIHTVHGDLILDGEFKGRVYLKGLLVAEQESTGRNQYFGYNFVRGRINRDRERLASAWKEAETIAGIWGQSIAQRGDDITDRYINLFRRHQDCADIFLASESVSFSTIKAIWSRLRAASPDSFFYSEEDDLDPDTADQKINIIITDFKKRPDPLPKTLWKLLKKRGLPRTPSEERMFRFTKAENAEVGRDIFCTSVLRALKASLSLNPEMKDFNVQFVKGGDTEIDLHFEKSEKLVRIHEKWVSFDRIHEVVSCEIFRLARGRPGETEGFSCDHVVEDLFEIVLDNVYGSLKMDLAQRLSIRRDARERIRQMPRLINACQTDQANELEVKWVANESGIVSKTYGADLQYRVTLHKMSTCGSRRAQLIYTADTEMPVPLLGSGLSSTTDAGPICHCPHQDLSQKDPKAIFSGLDFREEYFPMVARNEKPSFFGIPPAPVSPKAVTIRLEPLTPVTRPTSNTAPQSPLRPIDIDTTVSDEDEDETASQSLARNIPIRANTPHRRSPAPPKPKHKDLQDPDTAGRSAMAKDEKMWKTWHEQELSKAFSRLVPERKAGNLGNLSTVTSLDENELEYNQLKFAKNGYSHIRLKSEKSPEHIIFIHDIGYIANDDDPDSYQLLVTKYSFLTKSYPFQQQQSSTVVDVALSARELLLHFEDFNKMGKQEDAEIIKLVDILSSTDLASSSEISTDIVDHVLRPLPDDNKGGLFCRFGICTAATGDTACITPVSSSLLRHPDRWKQRKFTDPPGPLVFDLTPNVLGPSEGLSQAGYAIQAGIGFSQEHHLTWKMRHQSAEVYDGSLSDILNDIKCDRVQPPYLPDPAPPRVVLAAGEHHYFKQQEENQKMPSMKDFFEPLDKIDAAAESHLNPDFLAMLMPPALLHTSAIGRLSTSIFKFLEQRLSVHIKLFNLRDHGIPQERSVLVIVASPYCASLPWGSDWPVPNQEPTAKIKDLIGDLAFKNPRLTQTASNGFVCSGPAQENIAPGDSNRPNRLVYNHRTGQLTPPGKASIDMDSKAIHISCDCNELLVHPIRRDLLTVRELARLQGFNDNFVFYQSEDSQMRNVCRAVPPMVPHRLGNTIRHLIRSSLPKRLVDLTKPEASKRVRWADDDAPESARAGKRARVDDAEEEA